MYDSIPKISILVITYNQEKVIARAIDSLLCQKEYLHEIIIGEDYSTDNTRNIIKEYAEKFPELIKPIYNKQNLGIFGNIENLFNKPTGNVILWLSGDDEYNKGYFNEIIKTIKLNQIDCDNDLFAIYSNHKRNYKDWRPNRIVTDKCITQKGANPVSLSLRGLIGCYGRVIGIKVLQQHKLVRKDIGIFADWFIDIQPVIIANKNYYCNFTGYVYNAGVGVSVKTNRIEQLTLKTQVYSDIKNAYSWNKKDLNFLLFLECQNEFYLNKNINGFFRVIKYFFMGIDLSICGFKGLKLLNLLKFICRAF